MRLKKRKKDKEGRKGGKMKENSASGLRLD
jgi:hypothetical protein